MGRIYLLLLAVCFVGATQAQEIDWKKFHKQFSRVEGNLYASKYETSNLEYRTFLKYVKEQDDPDLTRKTMVDTSLWAKVLKYSEPYSEYYFQHEAYDEYPVVNVTREAARLFCEWLTQTYNAYPKREFEEVRFRLPSAREWKQAARAGNEEAILPWGHPYLRKSTGDFIANFTVIRQASIRKDQNDSCIIREPYQLTSSYEGREDMTEAFISRRFVVLAPVEFSEPNPFGLYNLAGNVAEYVDSQSRNTIGGSWNTTGYYLRIDADDPYAEVEGGFPTIGFRVFMEVIEE